MCLLSYQLNARRIRTRSIFSSPLLSILHDLVEPLPFYIGFDLDPDREMVAELEAELLLCVISVRKKFLDPGVADVEIKRPGIVGETVFERRHVKDLVIPGVV